LPRLRIAEKACQSKGARKKKKLPIRQKREGVDDLRGGAIDQGAVRIGTGRIGTDSERRLDRGGDSDE
jgi:hypothetical protein